MPARIAEWRENEALIRVVVHNPLPHLSFHNAVISVQLIKDGQVIARSLDGHPSQPRLYIPTGPTTKTFSWREVINEQALEYDQQLRQQILTTGMLPEGNYQLCVQFLDLRNHYDGSKNCVSFPIVHGEPPQLTSPTQCQSLSSTAVLFQWTPSTPPAAGLQYRLTVKPRYRGQTSAQAMANNPVRLQRNVSATQYATSISEANDLGADAADPNYDGHVWQVQALLNGRPYGRNQGLSTIECFKVPAMAIDPVPPSNTLPVVVWDIPYATLFADGGGVITCDLPPNIGDTLMMVIRVHAARALTEDTLALLDRMYYKGGYPDHGYFVYTNPGNPPGDTLNRRYYAGNYRGGYFVYAIPGNPPGDTLNPMYYAGGYFLYTNPGNPPGDTLNRMKYPGGYYVYTIPGNGEPPRYAGYSKIIAIEDIDLLSRSDTSVVPHTIFYPQAGLPLRQIAYNAGKEGAIIVERAGRVYTEGRFIPQRILLPICEIQVLDHEEFPEPLDSVITAVIDEENGVIEYSWPARPRPKCPPIIQTTITLDCPPPPPTPWCGTPPPFPQEPPQSPKPGGPKPVRPR